MIKNIIDNFRRKKSISQYDKKIIAISDDPGAFLSSRSIAQPSRHLRPMGKTLIFCTAFLSDGSIRRYENWHAYYKELFPDADLYMFHDGPVRDKGLRSRSLPIVELTPHLGRKNIEIFPGWRRSFLEGLRFGITNSYTSIVHLESDLFIKKKYRDMYLGFFRTEGHYVGFSRRYSLIEPAIQVFNDSTAIGKMIHFFEKKENIYSKIIAEWQIITITKPEIGFYGERVEDMDIEKIDRPELEYFAQCDYDLHKDHLS